MKTVRIKASEEYNVLIERGLMNRSGQIVKETAGGSRAILITDSNVDCLYAEKVKNSLEAAGYDTAKFVMKAGEQYKTMETLTELLSYMVNSNISRKDVAVALGGGVVGDLAGFAAAVYMRGIRFVQIPTTVLAAVDSSVGGKTAVDLPEGKNLAGAFHQPSAVICDPDAFETLPERQYRNGFAEIIKYGMIRDKSIFNMLKGDITELIGRCVEIKAAVVEEDEFEGGIRQILNFGHSIGHAVEKLSDFRLLHGEAVANGMLRICRIAEAEGICDAKCCEALEKALREYELNIETEYSAGEIAEAMKADKKASGGEINLIMPHEAGRVEIARTPFDRLESLLEKGAV